MVLFIFTQIYVLLKEIVIAFQSFGEANLFIRQHKMVKWIIIPGIIYTLLFIVAMVLFARSSNHAVTWLSQQLRIEPWLQKERNPFLAFIFLMAGIMMRLVLFLFCGHTKRGHNRFSGTHHYDLAGSPHFLFYRQKAH